MSVFLTHNLLRLAFFHTTINMHTGNITLKERQAGWPGIEQEANEVARARSASASSDDPDNTTPL